MVYWKQKFKRASHMANLRQKVNPCTCQVVFKRLEMTTTKTSNMMSFGLFVDISTIVGYLIPNQVYSYILDIYDL